jgi:hypothetical protein
MYSLILDKSYDEVEWYQLFVLIHHLDVQCLGSSSLLILIDSKFIIMFCKVPIYIAVSLWKKVVSDEKCLIVKHIDL